MSIPDYFQAEAYADAVPMDWNDAGLRSHQRIAARLNTYGQGKILFVNGMGWTYWDGKRWAPDERAAKANNLLTELLKVSWAEAMADQALTADVKASMTSSGGAGVLEIASRQLFALEVDSDPWLLNCQNGTLDLHTLELRPHNPADLITKVTNAAYDPQAGSEAWEYLTASSLPDATVREFLQRFVGSALIGRVLDHVLVILTGTGRNGKGLMMNIVSKALGDYAVTASNDLLIAGRYGHKSAGELASQMVLRGARWAGMSELNKGDKLAESTMKALTGGDKITAKHMGQNYVEFSPSHTFCMLTNDLPEVDPTAKAVWARLRVVPFEVSFEGREDTTLEERLEAEIDGVLAWAVAGLWVYHKEGLAAPAAVMAKTDSYRADNDPVMQFLDECCVIVPNARISRSELQHSYAEWARENNAEPLTPRAFTPRISGIAGVSEGKSSGERIWKGIGLTND